MSSELYSRHYSRNLGKGNKFRMSSPDLGRSIKIGPHLRGSRGSIDIPKTGASSRRPEVL
jgi:hypothetical protein